jgi:hypothetical protein
MKSQRPVAFVVAALALATTAGAQRRVDVPSARPGSISGAVVDTTGRPIEGADVLIQAFKRRTLSDTAGLFHFDSLAPGEYNVAVRRVGFYPAARRVTLSEQGIAIAVGLVPIARSLPTIVTNAPRGGISGRVGISNETGDTTFVVRGAKVEIVGSKRRAETDSMGEFFIKVPVGRHILSIIREGFETKLVSVTVPSDSGRRIQVWLGVGTDRDSRRLAAAMEAMESRIMRRNPVWSAIMTREDIAKSGMTEGTQLAQMGAQHPMTDTCSAIVNGGPLRLPMWMIKAEDVETFEVYSARPSNYAVRNARGGASVSQRRKDCETVFVWLKK